jgi:hypothetical protein
MEEDLMARKKTKRQQLAAIKGLGIDDCLRFFYSRASKRHRKIADLVETEDEGFERDGAIVSEGENNGAEDNGAYVLGWRWASFDGTEFDHRKGEN